MSVSHQKKDATVKKAKTLDVPGGLSTPTPEQDSASVSIDAELESLISLDDFQVPSPLSVVSKVSS